MLMLPISNFFAYQASNVDGGEAQATFGAEVTPGNAVEGSAVSLLASAAYDIEYVQLILANNNASGIDRQTALDFGWDPAGGTSYSWFLNDFLCGKAGTFGNAGMSPIFLHFPCSIPAGSQIAVRALANAASYNVNVWATFFGRPSRPELWRRAAYALTSGTYTAPSGVSFTPGGAAWGSWASLGTLAKAAFWHELSIQRDTTTSLGGTTSTMVELAHGDSTNKHLIGRKAYYETNVEMMGYSPLSQNFCPLPAGTELWVRGNCSSGSPGTGHVALVHSFGG